MVKNVGWIGTGVMGLPMAHHIFPLATNLYLYNRSPEKTQSLVAKGATLLSSPAQAPTSKLIFTMVCSHPMLKRSILAQGILPPSKRVQFCFT